MPAIVMAAFANDLSPAIDAQRRLIEGRVLESERIDAIARCGALGFAIDCALQPLGIPGHHAVVDECEGSGGGDEFLGSPATFGRERLGADLPL